MKKKTSETASANSNFLGKHLRLLREKTGLSRRQFAARMLPGGRHFLTPATYAKYENGQRLPDDTMIRNLVTIFVQLKVIPKTAMIRRDQTDALLLRKYMAHPSEMVRNLASNKFIAYREDY